MTTFAREGVHATRVESGSPDRSIISLKGELATSTETELRAVFGRAAQSGTREIRLNFAEVDHINSSGISVLIDLLRDCQEHDRRLSFSGLTPHYAKVFTFMGLTQYAPILEDEPGSIPDAPSADAASETVAYLDRRRSERRTTALQSGAGGAPSAPVAADRAQPGERRGSDRRQADGSIEGRLVNVLVPYMRAHSLSQRALAEVLDLSQDDLLDLAWQNPTRDPAAIDEISRRYGANGAALAAILAASG